MSMTGYERIKALLEGKPIDRSPIASWYHFPLTIILRIFPVRSSAPPTFSDGILLRS